MNAPPGGTSNGAAAMIEVENLTRYYGPLPALRDVSFHARRGEILGFLGPNGAGKTTAMRILTGYMPPTAGRVRVAGHDVVEESMAARKTVGYLPETAPLYREMTVKGFLKFMARLRGVSDADGAAGRVMARVAVEDHADQPISQLSKGYRQRVGLAQALIHEPEVIILDEPTIGLDPRQIREVRNLIRELGGQHTIILSTHILPEAQQVCDRVLIIHRGRIVAEDTPAELTARLTGDEQVRLAVPDDVGTAAVSSALGSVAGVERVEALGEGKYLVTAGGGASPRAALAATVVGRGWPLLELTPVSMTLEDIFLQLTGEEEQAPDTRAAESAAEGDAGEAEHA